MSAGSFVDSDNETSNRLLQQILDIWVVPEIRRRKADGRVEAPVELRAAQVLFFADKRAPQIRINEEVRAIARAKLKRGSKKEGEPVFEHELESVGDIHLTESEDPDCGHITLILLGAKWHIAWDCRYNKGLATKHLTAASRFLKAAALCMEGTLPEPFTDNLFSAVELTVRAQLLAVPDPRFRKKGTHHEIKRRFKKKAELGNFPPELVNAFDLLHKLRPRARYAIDLPGLFPFESKELLSQSEKAYRDAVEWFSVELR